MYCPNCGEQIDDKAVVCPKCGVPVKNATAPDDAPSTGGISFSDYRVNFVSRMEKRKTASR